MNYRKLKSIKNCAAYSRIVNNPEQIEEFFKKVNEEGCSMTERSLSRLYEVGTMDLPCGVCCQYLYCPYVAADRGLKLFFNTQSQFKTSEKAKEFVEQTLYNQGLFHQYGLAPDVLSEVIEITDTSPLPGFRDERPVRYGYITEHVPVMLCDFPATTSTKKAIRTRLREKLDRLRAIHPDACLNDLHHKNIGILRGEPVVIDLDACRNGVESENPFLTNTECTLDVITPDESDPCHYTQGRYTHE